MKKFRHAVTILVSVLTLMLAASVCTFAETSDSGWKSLDAAFRDGMTIQLDRDYIFKESVEPLVVPEDKTVTLDLNGYTLGRKLSEPVKNGNIITVYGELIIKDSFGGGTLSGGNNVDCGGAIVVSGGKAVMENGCITGNRGADGGAVYIEKNGIFSLTGGIIAENVAENFGGAVFDYKGQVQMNGGTIEANSAYCGGALCFNGSSAVLDMSGGRILKNAAASNGGAIYGEYGSKITIIKRSTISGNTATSYGGAIYVSDCDLTIGDSTRIVSNTAYSGGGIYLDTRFGASKNKAMFCGNVEISGNKDYRGASNLYLDGTDNQLMASDMGSGMNIGIRTSSEKTETTEELLPFDAPTADIVAHFRSDDERCVVGYVAEGVYLFANSNLPVYIHGVKGIDEDKPAYMTERNKSFTRPEDPEKHACVFDGWYKDPEFKKEYDFSTIVTDRVDLYAKWAPAIDSIDVKTFEGSKTEYLQGEEIDLLFVYIYAYPVEGEQMMILVTEDMVSGFDSSQVGPQTLTVTYGGCSDTYDINIRKAYEVKFDVKDLCDAPKIQRIPENGKADRPSDPDAKGYTFKGWFTDEDCTEEYDFDTEVKENMTLYAGMIPDVQRLSRLKGDCKTAYTLNEPLDISGLKVIAVMTDYSAEEIPVTEDMITGFDSSEPGNKTLTVTYAGKTISYDITVRIKITDMTLSETTFYCDGEAHFPMASVFAGEDEIAKNTTDNENVGFADLSQNVLPGEYTVEATGRGDYTGTLEKAYKIAVKPTAIKSLKRGKKAFTVKTTQLSSDYASGYQVRYSRKSSMKSAKTVYVGKTSTEITKKVKKLKKNKKYYVQIRTYKTISGKDYYSDWSSKKSVKTR